MEQDFFISEMGEKPEIKGETIGETIVDDVLSQEVNITHGGVQNVRAANVTMRQAGAHSVTADNLTIKQGGAVKAEAEKLEMTQGCLVAAKTQKAQLNTSLASLLIAQGDVQMEQSGAQVFAGQRGGENGPEWGRPSGCPKRQGGAFGGHLPHCPGGFGRPQSFLWSPGILYLRHRGRTGGWAGFLSVP